MRLPRPACFARHLALALLAALSLACGARSQLIAPDPVPRVDGGPDGQPPPDDAGTLSVVCPAPVFTTQTATETLAATATSTRGLPLTLSWTVERAPQDSRAQPMPADQATTRVTFDAGGQYLFRFTARDTEGRAASCTARAFVEPAIELLCPNDQSNFQGATVSLDATARSRLGRTVTTMWTVESRPTGSMTSPEPPTALMGVRLLLDQLGDWRLRLTATDSMGVTASCITNVHADPDVIVMCPADSTTRPFATVNLAGMATSRTARPLTFQWEIVDNPITSTASIANPTARSTSFTFDVAGRWTFRFTARNDRGNSASCTTRATAESAEAVRVELVWNIDRSCRGCNPQGGGIDLDLHLADVARAGGRWASLAPMSSDCYFANCVCGMGTGLCPGGVLQWPPSGAANNPQLDIDHVRDLPGPENINVLETAVGAQFDVGVHYFSAGPGDDTTPTVVRVYCRGTPVFETEVVRFSRGGGSSSTDNNLWRVGRITITPAGCTFERCGRPGMLNECIRPRDSW